jgi:hypothetical protein
MGKARFALTCAAVAALSLSATPVAFGGTTRPVGDAVSQDAPAAAVPAGCNEVKPSRVTTDSEGATYYYFQVPDQAATAQSGTASYDTIVQVLPPKGFDPASASDEQLEKYQYPRFTHASPEARQKYLSKQATRDIGVVTCAQKQRGSAAVQPTSTAGVAPEVGTAATYACTEQDNNFQTGYTGCSPNGFSYASVAYQAPTLVGGCPNGAPQSCGNATWAGLGGAVAAEPFYQAGTITPAPPAAQDNSQYLFIQYFSHGLTINSQPIVDPLTLVKPGDQVTTEVSYQAKAIPLLGLGDFRYCAVDTTSAALFRSYCGQVLLPDDQYDLILSDPRAATAEAVTENPQFVSALGFQLDKWTPNLSFSKFTAATSPTGSSPSAFPTFTNFPVEMCGIILTNGQTTCPQPGATSTTPKYLATVTGPSSGGFQAVWMAYGPPKQS